MINLKSKISTKDLIEAVGNAASMLQKKMYTNTNNNVELKSCPFCGSDVKVYHWGATVEAEIICKKCGVIMRMKPLDPNKYTDDDAYEYIKNKWNTRVGEQSG